MVVLRQSDSRTRSKPRLVNSACLGSADPPAVEMLVRSYALAFGVVFGVLARAGAVARAATDEVTWDAMSRAFEKIHLYDASRPFQPWLVACVRNTAYDRLREMRRHRYAPLDGLMVPAPSADDTAPANRLQDVRRTLTRAIDGWPSRDRALFLGFYRDHTTVAALAACHGIAGPTVRGRLSALKSRALAAIGCVKRLSNSQMRLLLEAQAPDPA